jgi:hypothetical protein
MMKLGLIEKSFSNYSSPVVMILKPDKTYRVCIDYRKLNAVTRSDSFPIPRVDDLIDQVSHATYLTKFDLRKGYYQCLLTERAKPLTAFVTPFGFYQFVVMPFGLRNAPATFCRLISLVTDGLSNCVTYIDDTCVYNSEWEAHLESIKQFLERLRRAGLTANLAKCEFGKTQVTYLGYTVGQGQVLPREAKVRDIMDFPVPKTKRNIKQFLGMIGFYRKFIRNFSTVAVPLTALLNQTQKFVWKPNCQDAFERLKAVLHNAPILRSPDYTKVFKVFVDASDVGIGAVLMQEGENQILHPIVYMSKKLDKCQKNYSTIEKECLALVWAVQKFQVYFGSDPVKIYTDQSFSVYQQSKNHQPAYPEMVIFPASVQFDHLPHTRSQQRVGRWPVPYGHIVLWLWKL